VTATTHGGRVATAKLATGVSYLQLARFGWGKGECGWAGAVKEPRKFDDDLYCLAAAQQTSGMGEALRDDRYSSLFANGGEKATVVCSIYDCR
jgi:hypothetical protein